MKLHYTKEGLEPNFADKKRTSREILGLESSVE
jgi:hypothetical protein